MPPLQEAMQGQGPSIGTATRMSSQNARVGRPDTGQYTTAPYLAASELDARAHYASPATNGLEPPTKKFHDDKPRDFEGRNLPYYYNNFNGAPVAYDAPSEEKENLILHNEVRQAADAAIRAGRTGRGGAAGVVRTSPITDGEVQYLKTMKQQVELAKFDDYVESFIDPRQPGNMKWLMEIYPEYVTRRLQQAHTDYEFALRNQMIDMWGMNTKEDLMFKYQVDQGKITGPSLQPDRDPVDARYAHGWLSPYSWQSPHAESTELNLPFASAKVGAQPNRPGGWTINRANRPLGSGSTGAELAGAMYGMPGGEAGDTGLPRRAGGGFPRGGDPRRGGIFAGMDEAGGYM